jgi:hypothetical protein
MRCNDMTVEWRAVSRKSCDIRLGRLRDRYPVRREVVPPETIAQPGCDKVWVSMQELQHRIRAEQIPMQ